jgi:cytochrome c oxidase subunit 2
VTRENYVDLFGVYWPVGLAVLVLVTFATLFAAWRYRAGRVGDHWPRGKDENTPLEGAYALLLALVVAALTYFTFSTLSDYEQADARPAGELIQVTAAKWNWRFDYPRHGIASQGTAERLATLTVPADTPIRFRGTSEDVIHSFFVPQQRFKRDVFPGRTTTWTMSFGREDIGAHPQWGACAEFCGAFHAYMEFDVNVLEPEDYERWVQVQAP